MSLLAALSARGRRGHYAGLPYVTGPLPEPPTTYDLLGVGSESTSFADYPAVGSPTSGHWYVDASVASSGNGQTLATAFKTLAEGLAALGNGQTLLVKGGTYALTSTITRSTKWANTTRIMGYGTDRPILDFGGRSIRGMYFNQSENELWHRFEIQNTNMVRGEVHTGHDGIFANYARWLTFSDIWIHDIGGDGLRLYVTHDSRVLDCAIWKQGDLDQGMLDRNELGPWPSLPDGFQSSGVGNNGPHSERNVFARCVTSNCPDDGFDCFSSIDTLFVDCVALYSGLFYDMLHYGRGKNGFKMGGATGATRNTHRGCFAAYGGRGTEYNGGHNVRVHNFTAYDNYWVGVRVGNYAVVRDTISVEQTTNYFEADSTVDDTYNTWNLSITDAGYASAGTPTWDYSLASGSACIDAGVSGGNLGASSVALEIAKEWLAKDLT